MRPEALQPVALAVAQERSLDVVLARIAQGLAGQPGVALARVWLLAPGDICDRCHVRSECPGLLTAKYDHWRNYRHWSAPRELRARLQRVRPPRFAAARR